MKAAVLGATGRTGRPVVDELLHRGHGVVALVRDAATANLPEGVEVRTGDARRERDLAGLLTGVDLVVSTLGPRKGDTSLHRDVAPALVSAMRDAGVRRFVGVSGAGIDVAGDQKRLRDRIVSALIRRVGGETVRDKAIEHGIWVASGLEWTLVRAPRLTDGPATGQVEHHAHRSARRTSISRADLAAFLVDCAEQGSYVRAAPLVAQG